MRWTIFLVVAAVAAILPASASAVVTAIERHDERIGQVVTVNASRWTIQNQSYRTAAVVHRHGSHRFEFHRGGRMIGYATSERTPGRWDVFLAGGDSPFGYLKRSGKREWRAYLAEGGDSRGGATGTAPIQGAAAVLIVWRG